MACDYQGDDMEIGFAHVSLLEMLGNLGSDNVRMEMSAPNRAGALIPADGVDEGEDLLMLVMPVMLNHYTFSNYFLWIQGSWHFHWLALPLGFERVK